MKNKRGVIPFYIAVILIAVAILVMIMVTIFLLKGVGSTFIEKIINLFRGR